MVSYNKLANNNTTDSDSFTVSNNREKHSMDCGNYIYNCHDSRNLQAIIL